MIGLSSEIVGYGYLQVWFDRIKPTFHPNALTNKSPKEITRCAFQIALSKVNNK